MPQTKCKEQGRGHKFVSHVINHDVPPFDMYSLAIVVERTEVVFL